MRLLAVILTILMTGCAGSHGFDRAAMRAVLHETVDSHDSAALGQPLSQPFRLALFFVDRDFPNVSGLHKADWIASDKQAIMTSLAPLQAERIVSDMFLLEDPTIKDYDEDKVKRAARRYGADAVLIVEGIGAVDRFNNGSAWLYATLVGAYLASGTESEALFILEGGLWDLPGDRRYVTQSVEGSWKQIGPAMAVEDKEVLNRAKRAALKEFGQRMADRFRHLR